MRYALEVSSHGFGGYSAADFRFMSGVFRFAAVQPLELEAALDDLRKIGRYTRDGEALRRKIIKSLSQLARDSRREGM